MQNYFISDDKKDDKKKQSSIAERFENQFLKERKVFLWGQVDDKSAEKVVNRLLFLEAQDPGKEIKFFINSPGGIVTSGMVMMDTIELITSPVSTICMGMSASMGSLLLSQGEKGKRFIWPSGRVMIHQPSMGGAQGSASDLEITAREIKRIKEQSAQILADNCGKSFEQIMKDFDRDFWMDANEAVKYGIADAVAKEL
ncbi:MAG: ATP-dependent Clp protease proteolytic subunit [Chitinophagales bacterium]